MQSGSSPQPWIDTPQFEANGDVRVPAFTLPVSSLLRAPFASAGTASR
jgi:hypothetical protein